LLADDARYYAAGMNANADVPAWKSKLIAIDIGTSHIVADVKGGGTCVRCVPARLLRQPGDAHVGVSDRFELFQAMSGDNVIKSRKMLVQSFDQATRFQPLRHPRKALEVGEHNCHGGIVPRLHSSTGP